VTLSVTSYKFERDFSPAETVQRADDDAGECRAVQACRFSDPDGTEITVMR
jgi:hypothetical protein